MNYSEYDKRVLPLVLLAIISVAFIFAVILHRRSVKIRSIPTAVVAITLLFLEVIKQRWNLMGEFNYFYLPFHYCSLFLLILPLAELCGARFSRIFRPLGASMAFVVSVAMYVTPRGIIGNASEAFGQNFYKTHTFIFHHLLVLYFVLVVALDLCNPRMRDSFITGAVGALYVGAAIPLAYAFQTNYCNLLTSEIPVLENFRIDRGQVAYTILMTLILSVGTMLGSLIYIGIHKLLTLPYRRRLK